MEVGMGSSLGAPGLGIGGGVSRLRAHSTQCFACGAISASLTAHDLQFAERSLRRWVDPRPSSTLPTPRRTSGPTELLAPIAAHEESATLRTACNETIREHEHIEDRSRSEWACDPFGDDLRPKAARLRVPVDG
jgi:hypothetical protein